MSVRFFVLRLSNRSPPFPSGVHCHGSSPVRGEGWRRAVTTYKEQCTLGIPLKPAALLSLAYGAIREGKQAGLEAAVLLDRLDSETGVKSRQSALLRRLAKASDGMEKELDEAEVSLLPCMRESWGLGRVGELDAEYRAATTVSE